jgi:hypothetical protein
MSGVDTLNSAEDPIFKPIFGTDWDRLPPVMQKHYANRPYTNDKVSVEGRMRVACSGPLRLLSSVFWLFGTVPPINEDQVPVVVSFQSEPTTRAFRFDRVFHFKNRKPYHFKSRMIQLKGNEVMEIMRFGICWRMNYLWEDAKVILRHRGYAFGIFGHFIPLPITFVIGRGDAEEIPVSDCAFDMCATYKGQFNVVPAS